MPRELEFDFALVDDAMLLAPAEAIARLDAENPIPNRLGPLIEFAFHLRCHLGDSCLPATVASSPMPQALLTAMKQKGQFALTTTDLNAWSFEFTPLHGEAEQEVGLWRGFMGRMKDAACRAGFDKATAAGLVGAMGELEDNARQHSGAPQSAIIAYRWAAGEFEMVVADAGIGVLQSLRSHPDYQNIQGHDEALRTALSPGESRFGRGSGRGTGFDTVFRKVAGTEGHLRFRSGDHSIEMSGLSPTLIQSKLKQRKHMQGFIASISCHPVR